MQQKDEIGLVRIAVLRGDVESALPVLARQAQRALELVHMPRAAH